MDAGTPPVVALVGPTASGKSSLAIEVAERIASLGGRAEVVNADSMLVYRGMDIGTAKPTVEQRRRVPHHLVDIMDVTQSASVAEFQGLARGVIADLRDRGVVPIVVGGSSLYMRAILDVFDFPGTDPQVRRRWEDELEAIGPHALHRVLADRNPEAAAAILPGNGRRIVRALEVIDLTGTFTARLPEPTYALAGVHQFGLELPREEMDERIAARVDEMWRQGLVDEVRGLVEAGLRRGVTASRGLGYQQVLACLAGDMDEQEARRATVDGTRRFARKQLAWFRRDPRISWIPVTDREASRRITTSSGIEQPQ
ncbi:tRNA (adenosine(37)-N6)-dimethylallyltransferase MiaA [Brooklawnia cerclae]|uniref:tRNA dimethylallyltransferase n=1 Tax=Brooklawnia cerclae TaxID=349934 RepID=A0ABX0SF27_9ACTN|nr:tRNA (adenosine(37)-N6)-dimethylallyltransferase MiaA [Brooklawnia cerclae]NIH56989.1 tRNA dimethylallyltransferase [Brooklawnia cerclae]